MPTTHQAIQADYWEDPPSRAAAHAIERWCFSSDRARVPPLRILPDGGLSVLFSAPLNDGDWQATVYGSTTRALLTPQTEPSMQIQARLSPGAGRSILGEALDQIRDRSIPLEAFWGTRSDRLMSQLESTKCWRERQRLIERAMTSNDVDVGRPRSLVRRAVETIRRDRGRSRIRAISAELNVGLRRLERSFHAELGISPKLFARIVRFRFAREAIRGRARYAEIAAVAGYSDHAHMTREFLTFADVPPSDLTLSIDANSTTTSGAPSGPGRRSQ